MIKTTKHFKKRIKQRLGISSNPELNKIIINRINSGQFSRKSKTDKDGVYKFTMYTFGDIKRFIDCDDIMVIYDTKVKELITISENKNSSGVIS